MGILASGVCLAVLGALSGWPGFDSGAFNCHVSNLPSGQQTLSYQTKVQLIV